MILRKMAAASLSWNRLKLRHGRLGDGSLGMHVSLFLAVRGSVFEQCLTCVDSIYQLGIAWGVCAQYLIQYAAVRFSHRHKDFSDRQDFALRLSFGIQLVPGITFLLGLLILPHSPRCYAMHGLWGSAVGLIADIHAKGDMNHPEVMAQYREMDEELRIERERGSPSFRMLLRKPLAKRLLLGMSVQAWSQLCGINIMMCLSATRL